jgi:hypothetical protein
VTLLRSLLISESSVDLHCTVFLKNGQGLNGTYMGRLCGGGDVNLIKVVHHYRVKRKSFLWMSLTMVLYYYFLCFGLYHQHFLRSLINLKTLKITTFRRVDLPSSSGLERTNLPLLSTHYLTMLYEWQQKCTTDGRFEYSSLHGRS